MTWSMMMIFAVSSHSEISNLRSDRCRHNTVVKFVEFGKQNLHNPQAIFLTVVSDVPSSILSNDIGNHQYSLGPGDVQDCLNVARVVVEAKSEDPISLVTGQGSTMAREGRAKYPKGPWQPNIDFEWKIAPSPEDNLADRVQKWRYDVCGGTTAYQKLESLYLNFLHENGLDDPRMGMRKSLKGSRARHQRKFHSHYQPEKRSAEQMDASEELGVSSKRLSMDSQPESVPSSTLMSPDISRQDTVPGWDQPLMGPLPPAKMERRRSGITRASRGSRGSTGSATARVTAGFEALTVQSPALAPLQGMVPPFEGSTWGGPSGTTGAGPVQFGGRYEPRIPGSGYQGSDQVQQGPGRGQLIEVYGHLQYVEPDQPRRRPQVGIPHTQYHGGGWNPPQPGWRQRGPADQAPAHRSYPPAQHAYSGSGHNVPVPSPNVQIGGSYPPRFPPAEPAMHARRTHLPPQPRHMAMIPPLGGNAPSIFADMPMAESPQLYSAEPQFGQGNIPSSVPPSVLPILQSLPPPAMDDIDLYQLQAPTTVPPVGENYPFSVPSTTETMEAGLIASPEHGYALAGSESYRGQEQPSGGDEDSDREDEDSDGEDDQFSHQDTSAGEPPLYPGDYDNGRFYHSPLPSGEGQPVQQDPYWGGNESQDESGQD